MSKEYTRTNPFFAAIKDRFSLCKPGTLKETIHIVLDLSDSGIGYCVGDSIAIVPSNDPFIVEKTLELLNASATDLIEDPKTKQKVQLGEFLSTQANLRDCTGKLLGELRKRQPIPSKQAVLDSLLDKNSSELLKDFQGNHDVLDVLEIHWEATPSPQDFCSLLKPIMPRFYSIASSQKAVGSEVHLTVALQKWRIFGKERLGVCTDYLCRRVPLHAEIVPVYINSHRGFTLPEDKHAPIIMVGPGTGIAPFRAFMQEREVLNAAGKNWLFFGEWNRFHHYFYEDYWSSLEQKGKLRVDLAFSRDQKDKIYVQHRMIEKGKEIYRWLQEGAYFYVCGDASNMAKDVEAALQKILIYEGDFSEEQSREYIKALRKEGRYLRDVY